MIDGNDVPKRLIGSDDERAVSPIIGMILMVAITVTLSAVFTAFVLDLGPADPDPEAVVLIQGDGSDEVAVTLETSDASTDGVAIVSDGGADDEFHDGALVDVIEISGATVTFAVDSNDADYPLTPDADGAAFSVYSFVGDVDEVGAIGGGDEEISDVADSIAKEGSFTVVAQG